MSWMLVNGRKVESDRAAVPAGDRGLLLGDGLFETMRSYDERIMRFHDHFERLAEGARYFNIALPWDEDELLGHVEGLAQANQAKSARVRVTLTRGPHTGSMSLAGGAEPTWLITAEAIPESLFETVASGIRLAVSDIRFCDRLPIFSHKTLNRIPHLAARAEAEKKGADEALILDERGNVACCSTGNFFAVQHGQLFTAPLSGRILAGVTRRVVLELAGEAGIPVREDFFSPLMVGGAEEAFMTNSVQEVAPVIELDGRPLGSGRPGPLAQMFGRLYRQLAGE